MKCSICNTDISGRYWIDAWGQTICADHKMNHCSSCGRFVKPTDTHLTDGRCLCAYCLPSVVRLPEHIVWVETRVRSILASHGISDIPKDIPIWLVSPTEMSKLSGSRHINLSQPGLTRTLKTMGLFFKHFSHRIYLLTICLKFNLLGYWPMRCFMLGKMKKVYPYLKSIQKDFAMLVLTSFILLLIRNCHVV